MKTYLIYGVVLLALASCSERNIKSNNEKRSVVQGKNEFIYHKKEHVDVIKEEPKFSESKIETLPFTDNEGSYPPSVELDEAIVSQEELIKIKENFIIELDRLENQKNEVTTNITNNSNSHAKKPAKP